MKKFKAQFGGKLTPPLVAQYTLSPNWKNAKFENLIETKMNFSIQAFPKLLYKQFFDKKGRMPEKPIPILAFDKKEFLKPSAKAKFIWFGHSVILIRMNDKTILIDPMLGPNASPIAPFETKRFSENTLDLIDELPEIDLMLLSHDHYDHIDYDSIAKLKLKTKQYFVALGVKRHLTSWGISEHVITEFDWWNEMQFDEINITFTPTRHFSGRGLTDRAKSLWGGWALKSTSENIWFSGDSGYGTHFTTIGEKLGPFDFAFIECGQYNENWHAIHMYPEEAIQAAIDAKVNVSMPVHWAGFALSQHAWKEPVERFTKEAFTKNLNILTPRLGQCFTQSDKIVNSWWNEMK